MQFLKLLKFILSGLSLLTLTSCFEIIEEVALNNDGSGQMTFTVNMSQSKTKLASIMLMDSINGYKVPSRNDIEEKLNEIVVNLKQTSGISNIQKTADYQNFIFSVKCDFKNIETISSLINSASQKQINQAPPSSYTFDTSKGKFERSFTNSDLLKKYYNKLKSDNKKIFTESSYTIIYRFQREIKSQSNHQGKISKSGKAIMQRHNALDLINGATNVANTIQLTN